MDEEPSTRVGDAGEHHQHSSAQARQIAERGTILRVQVGSGVHGTAISGQDDRDEMGLCLEPPEFITGVARVPNPTTSDATIGFEQYENHSAWERPGGLNNRSGAGDLDVIIYSARKYVRLALAGNPTVLIPRSHPRARSSRPRTPGTSCVPTRTASRPGEPPHASSATSAVSVEQ